MTDKTTDTPVAPPLVRAESDRPARSERIPFGVARTKLGVNMEIPGKHLHWVNDSGGRLEEAQMGGYTFVPPAAVRLPEKESYVRRLVGKDESGEALYAYLMMIDLELYEEDQKLLQTQVDRFDSAIRRGDLDAKPGENRYNAGIRISSP